MKPNRLRGRWWAYLAVLAVALMLASSGCTDTPAIADNDEELDAGTDDGGGTTTNDEDSDAGQQDDTGPEGPTDPCEDVSCPDGEVCYEGNCFELCDSDLDCGDNEYCRGTRCAPEDCQGMDCPEGKACYRGACYEQCEQDTHCPGQGGITCEGGACVPLDEQCDNLECDQVTCPPTGDRTTLTGTVTIPSGEYELPNVSVYVPNDQLDAIPEGASCLRCEDMLSGDPLVQGLTEVDGSFELINVPVGEEIPLVVQSGKWRRQIQVSEIEPCTENVVDFQGDEVIPLPSNQSEGNIPDIALTTGMCDPIECLLYNIGLDDQEFTTEDGDGAVNFYDAVGGVERYEDGFNDGQYFTDAHDWWDDLNNLLEYDVILHACECSQRGSNKPQAAHEALRDFTHAGGRVFMSHWENVWLEQGTEEFQSVANWGGSYAGTRDGVIDTSHTDGEMMEEWMIHVGAFPESNPVIEDIYDARYTIGSLIEQYTERWLHYDEPSETPLYFAFNTPIEKDEEDQCGRAVFTDLHVSDHAQTPFPSGCGSELIQQEEALLYMLFDISACIAPECEPMTCDDVDQDCGIHPDGCGGTIDCGHCCLELGEACEDDDECCGEWWCDESMDEPECTDRCRDVGETCMEDDQCCSGACGIPAGENEGECIDA